MEPANQEITNITLISIIIPSKNEADCIAQTIEACLNINYKYKEIIVVDDSTDKTPEIVRKYKKFGVTLLHRQKNSNGCCGARNLGMQSAKGEIIILLNSDNIPRPDFITQLLHHYYNGADYVIVKSVVLNQDNIWGKYVQSMEMLYCSRDPEWSEGFSCKKEAAESVGYIPGDFPIPFCRDFLFGKALNNAGFNKVIDTEIIMEHIVPSTLREMWKNRVWRGTFSSPFAYFILGYSPMFILIRELMKAFRTIIKYIFIFPLLIQVFRLINKSNTTRGDFFDLMIAILVVDFANLYGNFLGFFNLIRVIRHSSN